MATRFLSAPDYHVDQQYNSQPHSHLRPAARVFIEVLCLVDAKNGIGTAEGMEYTYVPPAVRRPSAPARLYGDFRLGEAGTAADSSTWAHASSAIGLLRRQG